MEKELKRIMSALEKIFKDKNPMISIYGDGSWGIEVDGVESGRKCRIGAEESGSSIEELEEFIKKNI